MSASAAKVEPADQPQPVLQEPTVGISTDRSAAFIYISYFFAAWGDRMWEFAAIIFLLDLFPGTLLPSSLLGLAETGAGILGSTVIGAYIDRTNRLTVVRQSVVAQNLSITAAGVLFFIALRNTDSWSSSTMWWVFGGLSLCACVARWASAMNKISLHKDWLVVVAHGDSTVQSRLNASMRRVDLMCSVLAPLAIGLVSSLTSSAVACMAISVWSAASFVIEWYVNGWVYAHVPALHVKKPVHHTLVLSVSSGYSLS
jgi:iron-regulated transporter 1